MASNAPVQLDSARYLLSENNAHLIFLSIFRDIAETSGAVRNTSRAPLAKITGGQPGSGKSAVIETLTSTALSDVITISGDEYRRYHPEYSRLQREDPLNAAFYTDRDVGRWVETLIDWTSGEGMDLIIESTMRVPDTFRSTSAPLRSKGYDVEAHIVAVRPSLSWLSVHLRYEAAIQVAGHGRFTTRASHDAAVAGLPVTLAAIVDEGLASQISIWERGAAKPSYATTLENGLWSQATKPDDWLREFWLRPPSAEDLSDLERGWALVLDMMRSRGAAAEEIAAKQAEAEIAIATMT